MRRAVALVAALLGLAPALAAADTVQPADRPTGATIGGAPNAIRFAGADRYHTSGAIAYGLRSAGTVPFDAPGSGGSSWGAATCPSSIIVAAGDRPADALAAAPLSDPTNRSDEPRLTRVAAADPDFDPPGGLDRVDTFAAPIIITTSGRDGATALAPPAREAAADLVGGACDEAREAIIVGGTDAVPRGVEAELLFLGYEEVFRVAGRDRYETAAQIAAAMPGEAAPAPRTCLDADSTDGSTAMGFYGNGVIEYRPTSTACELHGRAVVLAEASIGADALAAGWWTSYWQTPLLFVAPDGSLPAATRAALQALEVDTLIVLGGTARIPESTVDEAKVLASAVAGRFGGADRYATSTLTAVSFGGWHATGAADDFDGDRVCIAASTGSSAGWPDALAAGPWCGRLAANLASAPARVLEPVERASGPLPPVAPSHAAAPLLLVPAGGGLPSSVRGLLAGAFPPAASWCRGGAAGCANPGFAVAFGGGAVVSAGALADVSGLVAGDDPAQRTAAPTLGAPFLTTLDLSSRFTGAGPGLHACFERGGMRSVRWLVHASTPDVERSTSVLDLVRSGGYVDSASVPRCVAWGTGGPLLVGVAASGDASAPLRLDGDVEPLLAMSAPMPHASPGEVDGVPGTTPDSGTTRWQFRDAPPGSIEVLDRGQRGSLREASVDLTIDRQRFGSHRFVARVELVVGGGSLAATASGEAVLTGAEWQLAGRVQLPFGSGGFRGTLRTNATADNADDGLEWRLDVNVAA